MSHADLVLLSGGLDSTAALALHADTARIGLSVAYGQRHARELDAAAAVAEHYQLEHRVLDLSGWGAMLTGSALTDPTVNLPAGEYDADTMAATVVPNRNAVLLMAAAGIAAAADCNLVVTAIHGGDHELYPDCRPGFFTSAARTVELGTDGQVNLAAPFLHRTKADIVTIAAEARAPLGLTWSCYGGAARHCGMCGTCRERRAAFTTASIDDPTDYADQEVLL